MLMRYTIVFLAGLARTALGVDSDSSDEFFTVYSPDHDEIVEDLELKFQMRGESNPSGKQLRLQHGLDILRRLGPPFIPNEYTISRGHLISQAHGSSSNEAQVGMSWGLRPSLQSDLATELEIEDLQHEAIARFHRRFLPKYMRTVGPDWYTEDSLREFLRHEIWDIEFEVAARTRQLYAREYLSTEDLVRFCLRQTLADFTPEMQQKLGLVKEPDSKSKEVEIVGLVKERLTRLGVIELGGEELATSLRHDSFWSLYKLRLSKALKVIKTYVSRKKEDLETLRREILKAGKVTEKNWKGQPRWPSLDYATQRHTVFNMFSFDERTKVADRQILSDLREYVVTETTLASVLHASVPVGRRFLFGTPWPQKEPDEDDARDDKEYELLMERMFDDDGLGLKEYVASQRKSRAILSNERIAWSAEGAQLRTQRDGLSQLLKQNMRVFVDPRWFATVPDRRRQYVPKHSIDATRRSYPWSQSTEDSPPIEASSMIDNTQIKKLQGFLGKGWQSIWLESENPDLYYHKMLADKEGDKTRIDNKRVHMWINRRNELDDFLQSKVADLNKSLLNFFDKLNGQVGVVPEPAQPKKSDLRDTRGTKAVVYEIVRAKTLLRIVNPIAKTILQEFSADKTQQNIFLQFFRQYNPIRNDW